MSSPPGSSLPLFECSLDPEIDALFRPMCTPLAPDQVPMLREQVQAHVHEMHQALYRNEFLDLETARRVADRLGLLLDNYATYPPSHQALIVGAVSYFARPDDAEPDTLSLLGLDDDVAVLNYVLSQVGAEELRIEL